MRKLRIGLLLSIAVFGAFGCPSPATPPGPPAEIPSLVVFPQSVTIDVSAISSTGPSSDSSALVGTGGEFSAAIAIGGDAARDIQDDVLEGLLFPFTAFEIPVDPAMTTFSGTIPGDGADTLPESFKFDFSDYDFDGDGSPEGCSGCTCPVGCALASCPAEAPAADLKRICFRVWIQRDPDLPYERVMAGFFDLLPVRDDPVTPADEENPGKGRFRTGVDRGGFRFLVGVDYDHRNFDRPEDKTTDAFLLAEETDMDGNVFTTTSHDLITEVDKIKTVQINFDGSQTSESPAEHSSQLYSGRFRDDADFWNGSVIDTTSAAPLNIPTTCARISSGNAAPSVDCNELGIDASSLDVTAGHSIRKTEEADVDFPADFPELPNF